MQSGMIFRRQTTQCQGFQGVSDAGRPRPILPQMAPFYSRVLLICY
jgi:hypothetical protein